MYRIIEFRPHGPVRVVKKIKPSGNDKADYLSAINYINNLQTKLLRDKCFVEMSCDGKEWFALA